MFTEEKVRLRNKVSAEIHTAEWMLYLAISLIPAALIPFIGVLWFFGWNFYHAFRSGIASSIASFARASLIMSVFIFGVMLLAYYSSI